MKIASQIVESAELMKHTENISFMAQNLIDQLPEDGAWDVENKLRYASIEIVTDIANACGSLNPRDSLYKLGHARGLLFEIMSTLKIAHRLRLLDLQPELMLEIDETITILDKEAARLPKMAQQWLKEAYPYGGEA